MRRTATMLAVLTLAFALAGCGGDSPTESSLSTVVADVVVEAGEGQRGPPLEVFPDSVIGRALDGSGNPVADRLVNFEVVAGTEAGSFDVSALTTNAQGRVLNELMAGTRAWTARMVDGEDSAYTARLVASREGRPDEIASFTFAVDPDPPLIGSDRQDCGACGGGGLDGESPHTLALDVHGAALYDAHGNPVPFDLEPFAYAHAEAVSGAAGAKRTVVLDSAGCAPFYVRVHETGAKADSGVIWTNDPDGDGDTTDVSMEVGSNPWRESNVHHDECVADWVN